MELTRLNSEKVSKLWPAIRKAMYEHMPPIAQVGELSKVALLRALVSSDMRFWLATRDNKIIGFLTTTITKDICTLNRNLLVYNFDFSESLDKEDLMKIGRVLKEYAKVQGCTSLSCFSENKELLEFANKWNRASITHYIRVEVEDVE